MPVLKVWKTESVCLFFVYYAMVMCSPVRFKHMPYITSEQGNTLLTCSRKSLATNMAQKFALVSIPWDLRDHKSVAGKPAVKKVNGDFSGRLPIFPHPQTKHNYFKKAGEGEKWERKTDSTVSHMAFGWCKTWAERFICGTCIYQQVLLNL